MRNILFLIIFVFAVVSCKKNPEDAYKNSAKKTIVESVPQSFFKDSVSVNLDSLPYKTISEYGFFKGDIKNLSPNKNVLPYDLISPLFSDYASKKRFIWMSNGQQAKIEKEDEILNFPNGTILIKNFYYPKEKFRNERILETRLLVKTNDIWSAYPYVWNEGQTEAKYKVTGKIIPVSFTNIQGKEQSINYVVPNKNQCKNCHHKGKELLPIGPKVMHLNKEYSYSENEIDNQLSKWSEEGYISNYNSEKKYSKIAKWDDKNEKLENRARAYLDVNCAHCHNKDGSANTSGLFLTYNEKDISRLGFCKTPVATGRGSGGLLYDIVQGSPEKSILYYRMNSLEPDIMMPELGRISIHQEGLELMNEWIESLSGSCE